MEIIHEVYAAFLEQFPEVGKANDALGKIIHEASGPLDEKTRWLIKVAISASLGNVRALETHTSRARKIGATDEEIHHALLLLITTAGFPAFMRAFSTLRRMHQDS